MKDDRLLPDDDLKAAFRSVRNAYDGEHPEANLTLRRALFRARVGERRRRLTRWVVLPIAAVLAASTAWAGVTGRLSPTVASVVEALRADHQRDPTATTTPATTAAATATSAPAQPTSEPAAPAATTSVADAPEVSEPPPAAPPAAATAAVATAAVAVHRPSAKTDPPSAAIAAPSAAIAAPSARSSETTSAEAAPRAPTPPEAAPSSSAPDPHAALFAEAHRLHFIDRDPARALAAWDRYLAAAPDGRFSPEARYNRALALVRLGRDDEARAELAPFATGAFGSYRRAEATALVDALARDGGR